MSWFSFFDSLALFQHHQSKQRRKNRIYPIRALERLEQRTLLAGLAGDIWVTNTNADGDGSLAAAVTTANDQPGGDTIRFEDGVRGEIVLNDELVITDDLTIRGPGANKLTISGNDENRVFSVIPGDFESPLEVGIHRVTIANGLATNTPFFDDGFAFGGGLLNVGSDVTVHSVRMTGNVAFGGVTAGGAIGNEFGGTLHVYHSEFEGNASQGIVIAVGGAITSDIGPTLDDEGNPGDGTGKPTVNISHSTFANNRAEAQFSDPALAEPFGAFAGFALGGALSFFAGDTTVSHSEFIDNQAIGGTGANGSNGGFSAGGAIFTNDFSPFDAVGPILGRDSSLHVSHSRFVGNTSSGGDGDGEGTGGLGTGGAITASISFFPETASIRHSVFKYNTAVGGAGGLNGPGGQAVGGGVAALAGADVSVGYSKFAHNEAIGGSGGALGEGGDGIGGGIGLARLITAEPTDFELLIPSITIHHAQLKGNQATGGLGGDGAGGGNGNGGGLGVTQGATATVSRSRFARNLSAGGSGGLGGDGGNGQGGGVYNSGATTSIAHSIVFRNLAQAGSGGFEGSDGEGLGGGLFNADDDDLLGILSLDRLTKHHTRFNRADTAGDNFYGDLT